MSNIQIFENSEFGKLDILIDETNEVWFPATETAKMLGYKDATNAIKQHCRDGVVKHKGVSITVNQYGVETEQEVEKNYISEPDLYRLVFRSKLPSAERFEKWVVKEVLPSIRKHGAYMTPQVIEEAILNPDTIIKLATALKSEQEKNKTLQILNSDLSVKNQIMSPKADYFDELVDRNLLTNFRETAKQLKVREKDFIEFLLERKYIYRDKKGKLLPYADKNNGLFEVKECYNEKTDWSGVQTLITPKGRETFRLLMMKSA